MPSSFGFCNCSGTPIPLPVTHKRSAEFADSARRLFLLKDPEQHLANPAKLATLSTGTGRLNREVGKLESPEPGTFRFQGVPAGEGLLQPMKL